MASALAPAPVDSLPTWSGAWPIATKCMPSACRASSMARPSGPDPPYKRGAFPVKPDEQGVLASDFKPALAARFYESPTVFALERERLFHAQWFCVGRVEQLPARGDCLHV